MRQIRMSMGQQLLATMLGVEGFNNTATTRPAPVRRLRLDPIEKARRVAVAANKRDRKRKKRYEVWVTGIVEQPGDLAFKHNMPDHLREKLAHRLY